jgi:sulfur-carrier protein
MAIVHFSSTLTQYTGGVEHVTIEAHRVLELVMGLARRFPGLDQELARMAVAIDGQIYQDAEYETLAPDAEIYFVPRTAGG